MFPAIVAIAALQAIVVLAVLCLLVERLVKNHYSKRSEARLQSYGPHILGLQPGMRCDRPVRVAGCANAQVSRDSDSSKRQTFGD